jgi:hypothetical protein
MTATNVSSEFAAYEYVALLISNPDAYPLREEIKGINYRKRSEVLSAAIKNLSEKDKEAAAYLMDRVKTLNSHWEKALDSR